MSTSELNNLVAPAPEEVVQVVSWLVQNGFDMSQIINQGDSLKVRASVAQVESLFGVQVYQFTHAFTGKSASVAMGAVTIPTELASIVELVSGVSDFPVPKPRVKKMVSAAANPEGCTISMIIGVVVSIFDHKL